MQFIEILGTLTGLIYLWLEYRASIYLWITSIIMPAIYLFVYYDAGLYADFGINIYYLVIALYGWAAWRYGFKLFSKNNSTHNGKLPISHTPKQAWWKVAIIYLILQMAIVWILKNYTDSTVAWADAFTTALSIIGMWVLARKYIEQWWVWLVVDIASAGLYIYKGLYFTSALYALYAITVIFGYRKWLKLMNEQNGLQ